MVLNGKQVFAKVDDAEALKVIEAKEQEKAQAEADCKALQEEKVDRKNQELKGKSKEETLEGLPVPPPYHEEKLGIYHGTGNNTPNKVTA